MDITYSYFHTAKDEFIRHCKQRAIKLVIISGGSLIEVNELVNFFDMDCAAYYCEQGAIYSLDKRKTWVSSEAINPEIRQKYIGYIGELCVLSWHWKPFLTSSVRFFVFFRPGDPAPAEQQQ